MKNYKDDHLVPKIINKACPKTFSNLPATIPNNPVQITRNSNIKTENLREHSNSVSINNMNILTKEDSFPRQTSTNTVSSVVSQQKSMGDFARKNIDEDVVRIPILHRKSHKISKTKFLTLFELTL